MDKCDPADDVCRRADRTDGQFERGALLIERQRVNFRRAAVDRDCGEVGKPAMSGKWL